MFFLASEEPINITKINATKSTTIITVPTIKIKFIRPFLQNFTILSIKIKTLEILAKSVILEKISRSTEMLKLVYLLVVLLFSPSITNAQEAVVTTEFSDTEIEEHMANADVNYIQTLQNENFDFNQKDKSGNPPLYYILTRNQSLDVAKEAIKAGADINLATDSGILPFNIATSKANELQLQIMMMKTMGLNTEDPAVQEELKKQLFNEMSKAIEMAQMLIDMGADLNAQSSLGTPLMNAVTNVWNMEIVEMLIKAGADLNVTDKNGKTALFYAQASGNDDIIKLLIDSGADTTIQDNEGKLYSDMEKVNVDPAL